MAELKNDIEKLPKWAQDYIRDIQRERETAIRALNEYCDSQAESPFYYETYESIGEEEKGPTLKRYNFQAPRLEVEYEGVHLSVHLRDKQIDLQWSPTDRRVGDLAFIPESFQKARIVTKENMRD